MHPPGHTSAHPPASTPAGRLSPRAASLLRLLALLALVIFGYWFAYHSGLVDLHALRARVQAAGVWGPVWVAVAYVIGSLVFVPRLALTMLGGALLGIPMGLAVATLGSLVGALAGYAGGHLMGRAAVEHWGGERVAWVERHLSRRAFRSVTVIRLLPVSQFGAVNYTCGALTVPLRAYIAGTVLGSFPGLIFYTVLGAWPHLSR